MLASNSRDDRKHYDTFQCLTCHTTIVEAAPAADAAARQPVRRTRPK
jgi:hypothetical protein